MKKWLKSIMCNFSSFFNLPKHLSFLRKNKIIVLMYHGIVKSYSANPLKNFYGYKVSLGQFEEQIDYLSRHCNIISITDAINGENISTNKKNVIITFDDGYRNNYENAFPLLLRYNIPALFALSTGFVVNKKPLWFDTVEFAVSKTLQREFHMKWDNIDYDFRLVTVKDKLKFFKWFHSRCRETPVDAIDHFINSVLDSLHVSSDGSDIFQDPDYAPLSAEEVSEMSKTNLIEFASHAVTHYPLSQLDSDSLTNEIVKSKLLIEQLTNKECKYFCIPGGFYNQAVINAILDAKYHKVFSSDVSEVDVIDIPLIMGRYTVQNDISMSLFTDIINGPFHWIMFTLWHRK